MHLSAIDLMWECLIDQPTSELENPLSVVKTEVGMENGLHKTMDG